MDDNAINLITSKLTKKSWIINQKGKRITEKFKIINKQEYDQFVRLITDKGTYIYHKQRDMILYHQPKGVKLGLRKLSDNAYAVEEDFQMVTLYNAQGYRVHDFEMVLRHGQDGFHVRKDGKWGVINSDLEWTVTPVFEKPVIYNEYGYATLIKEEKGLIINKKGETVTQIDNCTDLKFLSEDLIKIGYGKSCGVINLSGQILIPNQFADIEYLQNHLIVLGFDDKKGLYDKNGTKVLECIYDKITPWFDTFIAQQITTVQIPIN